MRENTTMPREIEFTRRETELKEMKEALEQNSIVAYYCFDNSGLSQFLKKLCIDMNTEKQLCFYIDCEKQTSVAVQIAEQIFSECDENQLKKYTIDGGEVLTQVLKSLVSSASVLTFLSPAANIGKVSVDLINAIKNTLDVDIDHLSDYKIEKALISMFHKMDASGKGQSACILLDNAGALSAVSLEFVAKLFPINNMKILLTLPQRHGHVGAEILSKLSFENFIPYTMKKTFQRPDNYLISGLFQYYKKPIEEGYYNIFEKYDRDIHIIMSFIRGFNMNFIQLNKESLCILKIMLTLDTYINIDILYRVFEKAMHAPFGVSNENFKLTIDQLVKSNIIEVDSEQNVHLNKNLVTEQEVAVSLIEKLTISRYIIESFEMHKSEMTIPQLKFAIHNLDKDYNRRKTYILLLLHKQKGKEKIEQPYLDMLFYLDNKEDLIQVCSLYYNMQVYDVPYLKLQQHPKFLCERECQILLALLQERMHKEDYCQKLWELVYSSSNINEKCLIMAVLFTALYNDGENQQCNDILYNKDFKYYYENFQESQYYHFLLRNISYYMEDVEIGIRNYNYCLTKFKNSDPVNYNRTVSNFVGYLMKYEHNSHAKIILQDKIKEVKSILEFNDSRYLYLNMNYGIYLMRELDEDPTQYFEVFLSDSGTTETPYIYARINQALYVAKKDPAKSLSLLDEIFYDSIDGSNVTPTKILYKINRILVEYMNGMCNTTLLNEIKNEPLRGDVKDAEAIYSFYSHRFVNKIEFQDSDWKAQFHPGCIFYHGFDAELVLSTLAKPSFNI